MPGNNNLPDMTPSDAVIKPPKAIRVRNERRRQELLHQRIRESKAGVRTLLILAQYLIQVGARTEPNPAVRHGKRRSLAGTWRDFQTKLLGTIES